MINKPIILPAKNVIPNSGTPVGGLPVPAFAASISNLMKGQPVAKIISKHPKKTRLFRRVC